MEISYTVKMADSGRPVYQILMERLHFSRLLIKRVKLHGRMEIDGKPELMKTTAQSGQKIAVFYTDPAGEVNKPIEAQPDIPILFQDEWFIICNKPANLVTHPTYLHHANNLTARLCSDLLHPVNRLDRDTSGLVILAKNGYAHHALTTVSIAKRYLALVHGTHVPDAGEISLPIARSPGSIILREINASGQTAISRFICLKRWPAAQVSLLEYTPVTGRTHQLRLHSLMSGWPIVGETLYGCNRFYPGWPRLRPLFARADAKLKDEAYEGEFLVPREKIGDLAELCPAYFDRDLCLRWDESMPRQALHAYKLEFVHPLTGEKIAVETALPDDMSHTVDRLNDFTACHSCPNTIG